MGELSHSDERKLHDTNYAEWCKYVAPRWIEIGRRNPERKAEMWACASDRLKKAIRDLVSAQ